VQQAQTLPSGKLKKQKPRGSISDRKFMKVKSKTKSSIRPGFACLFGAVALVASLLAMPAKALQSKQAQPNTRKVKVSTPPEYPELARKMNIQGVARVLATIAPDGKVTAVKELGGHPVLVGALVDAVKKWKYEAADHESTIEVKFEFR
jgi:TonB family protein